MEEAYAGRRGLRTLFIEGVGAVALGLGFIGIFLPLLPTTPFVLLAALCFSANPRMYARIRDSPYFGEYLRAYREGGTVSRGTRVRALVLTWAALLVSMWLLHEPWLRILLAVVGVCVTAHLLTVGRRRRARGHPRGRPPSRRRA